MRNKFQIFSAFALVGLSALALLVLAGCSDLISPAKKAAEAPEGTGTVVFQVGDGNARTLAPVGLTFTRYEFALTDSVGLAYADETVVGTDASAGVTLTKNLPPDTYSLTVTGYTGTGATLQAVAKSSLASFTVYPGQTQTVQIVLSETADPSASGTFTYSVTFPETLVTGNFVGTNYSDENPTNTNSGGLSGSSSDFYSKAMLSLEPVAGAGTSNSGKVWIADLLDKDVTVVPAAGSEPSRYQHLKTIALPSGLYKLVVEVATQTSIANVNGGKLQGAYQEEYVYIFPGQTTAADYTFTKADFDAYVHLKGRADIGGTRGNLYRPTQLYINGYNWTLGSGARSNPITITQDSGNQSSGTWEVWIPSRYINTSLSTIDFRFAAALKTSAANAEELYSLWQTYTVQDEHLNEDGRLADSDYTHGIGDTGDHNYTGTLSPKLAMAINRLYIPATDYGSIAVIKDDQGATAIPYISASIGNAGSGFTAANAVADVVYGAPLNVRVVPATDAGYIAQSLVSKSYLTTQDTASVGTPPISNSQGSTFTFTSTTDGDASINNFGAYYTADLNIATVRRMASGTNTTSGTISDHGTGYQSTGVNSGTRSPITRDEYTYTVGDYGTLYSGSSYNEVLSAQFYVLSGRAYLWDGSIYATYGGYNSSSISGFYTNAAYSNGYRVISVSADVTSNNTNPITASVGTGTLESSITHTGTAYYQTWSIPLPGGTVATSTSRPWKKLTAGETVTFSIVYGKPGYADSQITVGSINSHGIFSTAWYNYLSPTGPTTIPENLTQNTTVFNSPNVAIYAITKNVGGANGALAFVSTTGPTASTSQIVYAATGSTVRFVATPTTNYRTDVITATGHSPSSYAGTPGALNSAVSYMFTVSGNSTIDATFQP